MEFTDKEKIEIGATWEAIKGGYKVAHAVQTLKEGIERGEVRASDLIKICERELNQVQMSLTHSYYLSFKEFENILKKESE